MSLVAYTDNLDHWDGRNRTCGSTGRHLGIGRLKAADVVEGIVTIAPEENFNLNSLAEFREDVLDYLSRTADWRLLEREDMDTIIRAAFRELIGAKQGRTR